MKPLSEVTKAEEYASVDVQIMTDYFAKNDYAGIEHKTYIVWDNQEKPYMYIVDLNDKTREALNSIYDYSYAEEEMDAPETVTIKGMTKTIPSDLMNFMEKS